MPRGGTRKDENGAGVVRKPIESPNRSAWAKPATTPAGPSAQHPPPQLRRGAIFSRAGRHSNVPLRK